jgi:hypothetical protein
MDAWKQHGILEDIDHAYMWGRGTYTATITLQNYIEDIEEKTQASHQSSNDLDVNSTTVLRSLFAEFLLDKLPYGCVKTDGEYPPGTLPATPDSALVASISLYLND